MFYHHKVIIAMASYQHCSYLYDHKVYLRRFMCCYCTLIYNNYVIVIMFYLKSQRNYVFLKNFESVTCGIFEHNCFAADKEIQNLPVFDHTQHSANTERQRTIGLG